MFIQFHWEWCHHKLITQQYTHRDMIDGGTGVTAREYCTPHNTPVILYSIMSGQLKEHIHIVDPMRSLTKKTVFSSINAALSVCWQHPSHRPSPGDAEVLPIREAVTLTTQHQLLEH